MVSKYIVTPQHRVPTTNYNCKALQQESCACMIGEVGGCGSIKFQGALGELCIVWILVLLKFEWEI